MAPSGMHPSLLIRLVLGLLALLPFGSLRAEYVPLSGQIGVSIAALEVQVVRKARCAALVRSYEARIEKLEAAATASAKTVSRFEKLVATNRNCVVEAGERVTTLETQLRRLATRFVNGTGADSSTLQQRIDALRAQEESRAKIAARLRIAQAQLQRLQQAATPDPVLLAQKTAVVNSLRANLEEAVAAVSQSNQQLVAFEDGLLAGNQAGSAALSWSIPTTRANGSPLPTGEIGGYEIYVVSESSGASSVITVGDPLATGSTIEGLEPDTYHFSMAAFDSSGNLSELSDVVSKTVQ